MYKVDISKMKTIDRRILKLIYDNKRCTVVSCSQCPFGYNNHIYGACCYEEGGLIGKSVRTDSPDIYERAKYVLLSTENTIDVNKECDL